MTRLKSRRFFFSWGWLLAAGLLWTGIGGCGKKGPPVAPYRQPLPQVTELQGSLEGDTVTLTWRSVERDRIRHFDVLRAEYPADQPACPGCPNVYHKVGEAVLGADADHYQFTEAVAAGFVYTYKVQPVGPAGERGPESNMVVIDRSSPEAEMGE